MRRNFGINFVAAILLAALMAALCWAVLQVTYLDFTLSAPLVDDAYRAYTIPKLDSSFGEDGSTDGDKLEGLAKYFTTAETDATIAYYVNILYVVGMVIIGLAAGVAACGFSAVFLGKKWLFYLTWFLLLVNIALAVGLWVGAVYAGNAIESALIDAFSKPNRWIGLFNDLLGLDVDTLTVSVGGMFYLFTPIAAAGILPALFLGRFK